MVKKETAAAPKPRKSPLKSLILLGLILGMGFFFHKVYKNLKASTTSLPLPYKLTTEAIEPELVEKIANSQVLIIGDEKALWLERLSEEIQKQTSKNLAEPLRIINLGQKNEGIHRTLYKISKLEKIPKLVFFLSGGSEFVEKTFHKSEMEKIFRNIEKYEKFSLSTLYITFPFIAPLFYESVKKVNLGSITPNSDQYLSDEKMKQLELIYRLYQIQLDELLRIFRLKDTKLVFITGPYNYELAPTKVCEIAVDDLVTARIEEYKKLLNENRFKEAIKVGLEIAKKHQGHAEIFYLLGENSLRLGLFKRAREYLSMAKALDCGAERGSPVFNSIQKSFAEKKDIELIDFDLLINSNLGDNKLFLDEQVPQEIYFEQLQNEMIKTIKVFYKI
jgi:hypothetical protein